MAGDKHIRLRVRGVEQDAEISVERLDSSAPPGIAVDAGKRISLSSARAAGEPVELEVSDTDVACVEYADGFRLWTRVDDLRHEFAVPAGQATRGGRSDIWEIDPDRAMPTRLPLAAGERGIGKVAIKALEFFGVDIKAKTAEGLSRWFEDRQLDDRGPGLYRLTFGETLGMVKVRGSLAKTVKPLLIFLHGTASSTAGSFGKLWDQPDSARERAVATLAAAYGDRIYGLEHRTFTESPIDNAMDLARSLPDGAQLHLVSHSRGGLIGELLCLGERLGGRDVLDDKLLDRLFSAESDMSDLLGDAGQAKDGYAAQRKKLDELLALLDDKAFRITRFVRVACPARGTTLASGRLDRWLSVFDYLGGQTFAGDAIYFLLGVVKQRTDPRSLPGLEAMMPHSAVVRLLNHPQLTVRSDLSVVAGDIEAGSLWQRLKLAVTDWFYASDHDLVVNTGSMYGGLRRLGEQARHVIDQGAEVNHFRYFANPVTVRALAFGLTRDEGQMGDFKPLAEAAHKDEQPAWRSAVARSATQGPRPLAIVLPGTMGSALSVGNDEVWLQYLDLATGGLEKLTIDAPGVVPVDLLGDFYGDFLVYLSRTHKVEPHAYDWRLSLDDAVAALAERLESGLSECELSGQPLHLVAHSMGGLVARLTLARNPQLWARFKALTGSCLLMLGTPNRGSHEALRWLTGFNPTLGKLRLLDLTNGRNGLLKIVSRYPGLLELLPAEDVSHDFADPTFWSDLRDRLDEDWPLPQREPLRKLHAIWRELRDAPADPECMRYVAGCAPTTVNGFEVDPEGDSDVLGNPRPLLTFFGTRRGDGTVTWDAGRLPGVPTCYVEGAQHDELLSFAEAFPAYLDLLQTRRTDRLPDSEPRVQRGGAVDIDHIPLPVEIPDSIPSEADLRGFVFGGGRVGRRAGPVQRPRVSVTVRHGDLVYANAPVCVGHYAGDTIVSAERALDRGLDGALLERAALGLYPGPVGTHHVFIHPEKHVKPGGAIIVGLGEVGSLTPGRLELALVQAFLDYASEVARWPDNRFGAPGVVRKAAINCLLIGTGFDNMTVRDSLAVILRAVRIANERLHKNELDKQVLIDHLTLLELYEDVAILAARELASVLDSDEFRGQFDWPSRQLDSGVGGHRRVLFEEAPNWWHRLEIVYNHKQEMLRYFAFTDRARVEQSLVAGDMRLADDFIRDALRTTRDDPAIAKTLFEMLVPNRIKEQAPDQRDLVLVVDETSARFPWELMQDRWSRDGRPLAVAAGMLRQLKVSEQRESPAHSMAMNALIVGDPDLGQLMPGERPLFTQLPGARTEAEAVVGVFGKQGFATRSVIGGTAGEILGALHEDGYRILHLAGHGVHGFVMPADAAAQGVCGECEQPLRAATKPISGMLIGDRRFLTPGDVCQMRVVPELVFINCCHLGRTQSDLRMNELAANLGVQFIQMGVKAVIAAGWAVDDAAAKRFAQTFYQSMFDGQTFGDAVREARAAVWLGDPGTNTWGAYQCYGDPGYRLMISKGHKRGGRLPDFVCPSELIVELRNLTSQVKTSGNDEATVNWLLGRLDGLLERLPANARDHWLAKADVSEMLGIVYGELGLFNEAITCLDRALEGEVATLSVAAIEQRANFRVRDAAQRVARAESDVAAGSKRDLKQLRSEADEQVQAAIDDLERLCAFASTAERQALLGGAYKRRALIAVAEKARLKWLDACADHYEKAHRRCSDDGKPMAYPLIQWLNARALAQITGADDKRFMPVEQALAEQIDHECGQLLVMARDQERLAPDFWNTAVPSDCVVLQALATLGFDTRADRIVEGYLDARRRGGSPRELHSVREHLEFIRAMLAAKAAQSGRQTRAYLDQQVGAIDGIVERLNARWEATAGG